MGQLPLGKLGLSEDIVECLQLGPRQARRVQNPVEEGIALLPVAEREEGAQGEGGVT